MKWILWGMFGALIGALIASTWVLTAASYKNTEEILDRLDRRLEQCEVLDHDPWLGYGVRLDCPENL